MLAASVTSKVVASRRCSSPKSRAMCRIWHSTVVNHDNPTHEYGPAELRKLGKYGIETPS
ncbi:Uncharacterised protein [Mycobacteroides abscessus subsp. abscessus]|nr:Uncharacterised protein [Mycobacteroides abscessus subsp. abscessus]